MTNQSTEYASRHSPALQKRSSRSLRNQPNTRAKQHQKTIPTRQAVYIAGACSLLLGSTMLFFVDPELSAPFFSRSFNIYRCAIMLAAIVLLMLATKDSWLAKSVRPVANEAAISPRMVKWLRRLNLILPIISIVFSIIQLTNPEFASLLVRKETWPFFRNAIFVKATCQIVGVIAFIKIANHYRHQRNWLALVVATAVAIVLFAMAGEELSWGQRIFGWQTPSQLASRNAQSEMNFHNINTQLFQNSLYFAGWLLLIGFSFWRRSLARLVNKFRPLNFLVNWLPPLSFVGIFAAGFAFCDPLHAPTGLYYGSNLFIVIATATILSAMIIRAVRQRRDHELRHYAAILVIFLTVLVGNLWFSLVWDQNAGAPTEYLEMYISFGLMLWSLTIHSRLANKRLTD